MKLTFITVSKLVPLSAHLSPRHWGRSAKSVMMKNIWLSLSKNGYFNYITVKIDEWRCWWNEKAPCKSASVEAINSLVNLPVFTPRSRTWNPEQLNPVLIEAPSIRDFLLVCLFLQAVKQCITHLIALIIHWCRGSPIHSRYLSIVLKISLPKVENWKNSWFR